MIQFFQTYILPIIHARTHLILAYFVAPLMPIILMIGMGAYVIISEKVGAPRIIDGRVDNAPARASSVIILMSPFFYVLFGIANLVDSLGDRFRNPFPWFFTVTIILSIGGALSLLLYSPQVDSSPVPAVRSSFIFAFFIFFPMAFMRRFFRGRDAGNVRNP